MLKRCGNPNDREYLSYGGRGIRVCDGWYDYEDYFAHVSVLPHYGEPGRSLDRIDNDGDYEPGNVRWATASEQARNRRPHARRRIEDEKAA